MSTKFFDGISKQSYSFNSTNMNMNMHSDVGPQIATH